MTVDRDRAQLVLIAGLVIAVGLVGIAIILNSGIYTHNLASRADPTASEAAGHAAAVRDSTGGLVEFAVRHHPNQPTVQEANVTAGVSNVSDLLAMETARHGVLTNVTVAAVDVGWTVNQAGDSDRAFTNTSGDPDWEVATDVEGVRAFRMNVSRTDLNDQSGLLFGVISSDTFNVTLDPDSGTAWTVSVYRNSTTATTNLTVTNTSSGRTYGPCAVGGPWAEIDVTGASVGGSHCDALRRLDDLSRPFDVEFHNADNAVGSYSLVVDGGATVDDGDVADPGNPGPTELETLYSVRVDLQFQSQRVDYRTTITVAPGELDE